MHSYSLNVAPGTGAQSAIHDCLIPFVVDLLPPLKKEVMFLVRSVCLFVCLSVRRITRKLVNGF